MLPVEPVSALATADVVVAAAATPVPMRLALSVAPFVCGILLTVTGYLGHRERLHRNRFAGIRTSATMRTAESFRLANKVAAVPVLVAGIVGLTTGALTLGVNAGDLTATVLTIGMVGMVLIAFAGGMLGHRAAVASERAARPAPGGCPSCPGCGGGGCGALG